MATAAAAQPVEKSSTSPKRAEETSKKPHKSVVTTQALLEAQVDNLLQAISPNETSALVRRSIIDFVQALVKKAFANYGEVDSYVFGSVALQAYLPDGDIDFSLFQRNGPPFGDAWATRLYSALLQEQKKPSSSAFLISEPHIINADVKLVKFLVNDVVVDVSFQTLGGLCAANFLQAIDGKIGRSQLFIRSIILTKAWCYYESRLLGAHHGLLSSYALEVLVLQICNLYHARVSTPLQVLHSFLQVYGNFDWDRLCVTVQGPVSLEKLQRREAPPQPPVQEDALLGEEVLGLLLEECKAPTELGPDAFQPKFLNIMDPMLATNNLGRSVSKTNASRIRKAWGHAAQALTDILQQKDAAVALAGLQRFFGRVARARPLPRALMPPHVQHGFVLPAPPVLQQSSRPPASEADLWRLQQQGMMAPHLRGSGNGAHAASHAGRSSRGNGLPNGQLPGGWHVGLLPPEVQRAHAAVAAAAAAGQLPNLRRTSLGPPHGVGKDGGRGRLPYTNGGSVRSKSGQAMGMGGSGLESLRSERSRQGRPASLDMFRSYSADGSALTQAHAYMLAASYGMQAGSGRVEQQQQQQQQQQSNGFASGQHADARALRQPLRSPAVAPSVSSEQLSMPARHLQHTRSDTLSDRERRTSSGKQTPSGDPVPCPQLHAASAGSVPIVPALHIVQRAPQHMPLQHPQPPPSEALHPLETAISAPAEGAPEAESDRHQNTGSVRGRSSGQVGRAVRPVVTLASPHGGSPLRRPPVHQDALPPPLPPIIRPPPLEQQQGRNGGVIVTPPAAFHTPQLASMSAALPVPGAPMSGLDETVSPTSLSQPAAAPPGSPQHVWDDLFPSEASLGADAPCHRPPPPLPRDASAPQPSPPLPPPASVLGSQTLARRSASAAQPVGSPARPAMWHSSTTPQAAPLPYRPPLGDAVGVRVGPDVRRAPASAPASIADGQLDGRSPGSSPVVGTSAGLPAVLTGHDASLRNLPGGSSPSASGSCPNAFGGSANSPLQFGMLPMELPSGLGREAESLHGALVAPLAAADYPPLPVAMHGGRPSRPLVPSLRPPQSADAGPAAPAVQLPAELELPEQRGASGPPPRLSYKMATKSTRAVREAYLRSAGSQEFGSYRVPVSEPTPSSMGSTSGDTPRSAASAPSGPALPSAGRGALQVRSMDAGSRPLGGGRSSAQTASAGTSPRGRLPPYQPNSLAEALPTVVNAVVASAAASAVAAPPPGALLPAEAPQPLMPASAFELQPDEFPTLAAAPPSRRPSKRGGSDQMKQRTRSAGSV